MNYAEELNKNISGISPSYDTPTVLSGKYEDNIVYIKMLGTCAECSMLDFTLKDAIETSIIEEIPEVKEVVNLINQ